MELKLEHTFYWYDGPILFLASAGRTYFLAEKFPEDKITLIRVSYKRFQALLHNRTTIRQAQMFPEYGVASRWMIDEDTWYWHPASCSVVNSQDYLEIRGEYIPGGYHIWSYGKYEKARRKEKRGRYAYKLRHRRNRSK